MSVHHEYISKLQPKDAKFLDLFIFTDFYKASVETNKSRNVASRWL